MATGTARTHLLDDGRSVWTAVRCALVLSAVLAVGTIGFKLVEPEWTVWRALYFTTITVTTVGYGDEGLSPVGQQFAVVLLLSGIGTATYSLSQIVQFAVDHPFDKRRMMAREIARTRNHVVVCGYGRMGRSVCERLATEGVTVVVVERDGDNHDDAVRDGRLVVGGCGTEDETLVRAGVERARGVVCCTDSDADNVFVTLSVRRMNEKAFIACRADAPGSVPKMQHAGADLAISPHTRAGSDVAHAVQHPNLARLLHGGIGESEFTLAEIGVPAESDLVGRAVSTIGVDVPTVSFVALRRDGRTLPRPSGTDRLEPGDFLIVAGRRDELASLSAMTESVPVRLRRQRDD